MLQKENRLRKNRDFINNQKIGRYYNGGFIALRVSKNDKKDARVGIIAANKVFHSAPERNKARRRVREVVRRLISEMNPGIDVVIVLKDGIAAKGFAELSETLSNLMKRAKVFLAD